MKSRKYEEKIQLITKIMNSYILANNSHSDKWLVDKFDKLYDMELDALRYLAELRKIKHTELVEY